MSFAPALGENLIALTSLAFFLSYPKTAIPVSFFFVGQTDKRIMPVRRETNRAARS